MQEHDDPSLVEEPGPLARIERMLWDIQTSITTIERVVREIDRQETTGLYQSYESYPEDHILLKYEDRKGI